MENVYYISLPYATFGIISRGNAIIETAPMAYWLIKQGKTLSYALAYYKRKGAVIELL